MSVDPQQFGEVKAKGEANTIAVQDLKEDIKEIRTTQKKHTYGILLAILSPAITGATLYPSEAKDLLISMAQFLIPGV